MMDQLAPLLRLLPWVGLVVIAVAYSQLRWRHRRAKDALHRVIRERDEAREQLWRAAQRRPR